MIGIRVNDTWLDVDLGTKIRLQLTNPMIERTIMPGEFSFPFRLPASPKNLRAFQFYSFVETEGQVFPNVDAYLYVSGILLYKGILIANYQGKPYIDVNFAVSSSMIAIIKDVKVGELNWGDMIDIAVSAQSIVWNIDNNWIGGTMQCVIEGYGQFLQTVTTTVNAALLLLKAQIDAVVFFGDKTITVSVTGNEISFTADWLGVSPGLNVVFVTQVGRTQNIVSQYGGPAHFNEEWNRHMEEVNAETYPQRDYVFFPVRNTKSEVPWFYLNDIDPYGFFEIFYQNFYNPELEEFIPQVEFENVDSPGTFSYPSGVTPFVFVAKYLDKIASALEMNVTGFFHGGIETPIVVWSNYLVDLVKSESFADNLFTTQFFLKDTLPDVTVEEFIQACCDTFCLGVNAKDRGTSFEMVLLSSLLYSSPIVDWSRKVTKEAKIYAEKMATGFLLDYNREEYDQFTKDALELIKDWEFVGAFPSTAEFPNVQGSSSQDAFLYAYAIDTNKLYLRTLPGGTFAWVWTEIFTNAAFGYGPERDSQSVKVADPLSSYVGSDDYGPLQAWKVPHVQQPISLQVYNRHRATIKKVRFLQYLGMQGNEGDKPYPCGSTDGINLAETMISGLDLRLHGEYGLFKLFWKPWLDFLLMAKKVEMPVNLSILDVLNIDWGKRVHIDGSHYLVYDLKPDMPITKETMVTLIKIE